MKPALAVLSAVIVSLLLGTAGARRADRPAPQPGGADIALANFHDLGCFRVPHTPTYSGIDSTGSSDAAGFHAGGNGGGGSLYLTNHLATPPRVSEISIPAPTACSAAPATWQTAVELQASQDPSEGLATDCVDNFSPFPDFTGRDSVKYPGAGRAVANGRLHTYAAGTTANQATYGDPARTRPNANPVVLDSTGKATVHLDPALAYRFVLKDGTDTAVVWDSEHDSAAYAWSTAAPRPLKKASRGSVCPDYAAKPQWDTAQSYPSDGDYKMNGLLPFGGFLYMSHFQYYDGGGTQRRALSRRSLSLRPDHSWQTMVGFNMGATKWYDGPITEIMSEFTAALGGTLISSHLGAPIAGLASQGPDAIVWDPAKGFNDPVPHTIVLGYPPGHEVTGNPNFYASNLWSLTSHGMGVIMPKGWANLLFFERLGITQCYGDGGPDLYGNRGDVLDVRMNAGDAPIRSGILGATATLSADGSTLSVPGADLSRVLDRHYGVWVGTSANGGRGNARRIVAVAGSGTPSASVKLSSPIAEGGGRASTGLKYQIGNAGDTASTDAASPQTITIPNQDLAVLAGIHIQFLSQKTPDAVGGQGNDPAVITRPGAVFVETTGNPNTPASYARTGNRSFFGSPSALTSQEWIGGEVNCNDPINPDKGNHGYPYTNRLISYRLADLIAVRNRTRQMWEPRPVNNWDVTKWFSSGGNGVESMAAAHDWGRKRIYFVVKGGEGAYPIVRVIGYD